MTRWDKPQVAGRILIASGLGLLPWMVVLACVLTRDTAAWVGLDALEAAGLVGTGVLLFRGHPGRALTASAASALLLADAWFDITTAASAAELWAAVAMACCAELPMALLCAVVAMRSLPRPDRPGSGTAAAREDAPGSRGRAPEPGPGAEVVHLVQLRERSRPRPEAVASVA